MLEVAAELKLFLALKQVVSCGHALQRGLQGLDLFPYAFFLDLQIFLQFLLEDSDRLLDFIGRHLTVLTFRIQRNTRQKLLHKGHECRVLQFMIFHLVEGRKELVC